MNSQPSTTRTLPGIPILPGRNTPFIRKGPPKNVPQKPQQEKTEATEKPGPRPDGIEHAE